MLNRRSIAAQCATHLIGEIDRGRWVGKLPGVDRLAAELAVSRETVREALNEVEREGRLISRGTGKARLVAPQGHPGRLPALRVSVLLHEPSAKSDEATQLLLHRIRQGLLDGDHVCCFAPDSQEELGHNVDRIARMVSRAAADAWVVISGSLELLRWFASQPCPVIALGGRLDGLGIAGVARDASTAFRATFRQLIELGHRRIALICPEARRQGPLSPCLVLLQEELAAKGLPFGSYNAPDWEETPVGLQMMLAKLFRLTPPTALQIVFAEWTVGVLGFLAERGLRVPQDVTVICENESQALSWHEPRIAHYTLDAELAVQRVMAWAAAIAANREDREVLLLPTRFEPGGSIGPPPPTRTAPPRPAVGGARRRS